MQYIKIILLTSFLFFCCNNSVLCQTIFRPKVSYQIPENKIFLRNEKGRVVNVVTSGVLKEGFNYSFLKSGQTIYVEYKNKQIVSFVITTTGGKVLATIFLPKGNTTQFVCSGNFCACQGDGDCNDLFTSGNCGGTATCYENSGSPTVCLCAR